MKCGNCGAALTLEAEQAIATCDYCGATARVGARPRRHEAGARSPLLLAIAGAVTLVAVAFFVFAAQSATRESTDPPVPAHTAPPNPEPESPPPEPLPVVESIGNEVEPFAADAAAAVAEPAPPATAADDHRKEKHKPRAAPAYAGPILTKQEAEQALTPELLSCMKKHGVYYLITRLGNQRRAGTVPPLELTGTSVVDYLPAPNFAKTPLGQCVAGAGSGVRAPAYKGNYIYFGLRNEGVPDPLATAPPRLDTGAAKQALSALDDEARDCAARHPEGSRPGESVRVNVRFLGATGQVDQVSPLYVDAKSSYGRCLVSVYGKATVGKFRKLDDKLMYVLMP